MKKALSMLAVIAVITIGGMGLFVARTQAATSSKSGAFTLGKSDTHSGLLVRAEERVIIDGVVNGDIIVMANTFELNGSVNGSVYVLAQNVKIDGDVAGNVHAVAGDVEIGGQAASVYAAASSFVAGKDMRLGSTLAVAASSVKVAGQVGQSAYLAGSTVTYDAQTAGSVKVAGTEISLGSQALISGDLRYSESAKLTIANDQNIAGSIEKFAAPSMEQPSWASVLAKVLYGILAAFVVGMALLGLLPASVIATTHQLRAKPGRSLLAGFGFVVGVPILAFMLLFTLIGLELAVLIVLAYVAALMIGSIFTALLLGRLLLSTKSECLSVPANALPLLVGLAVLGLLSALPGVGGLIGFMALLGGTGALVTRSWERMQNVRRTQLGS